MQSGEEEWKEVERGEDQEEHESPREEQRGALRGDGDGIRRGAPAETPAGEHAHGGEPEHPRHDEQRRPRERVTRVGRTRKARKHAIPHPEGDQPDRSDPEQQYPAVSPASPDPDRRAAVQGADDGQSNQRDQRAQDEDYRFSASASRRST